MSDHELEEFYAVVGSEAPLWKPPTFIKSDTVEMCHRCNTQSQKTTRATYDPPAKCNRSPVGECISHILKYCTKCNIFFTIHVSQTDIDWLPESIDGHG